MIIEEKYLELIHKDIDKEITPREKEMLVVYLKNNPDAEALYLELIETEYQLDSIPDMEPSDELKKSILNSIDYNRYAPELRKQSFFAGLFKRRKPGFIVSFSLGLIAGIAVLAALISNPALVSIFEQENISGTMGLADYEKVDVINISADDFTGTVEVIKGSASAPKHSKSADYYNYGLHLDLNSFENYDIEIQFDPLSLSLDRFISTHPENIRMSEEKGILRISSAGAQTFSVLFSSVELSGSFNLRISGDGTNIFERQVFIKN